MPITTTVITGATSGIGKETALALAKKGHALYLLVRDMDKGEETKQELINLSKNNNIYLVFCDLADMDSIRNAVGILKSSLFSINVLINNAGGIFAQRQVTRDGFEMTFAVNYLGHFLLTHLLMPLLEKGQARVINVSSDAHRMGKAQFKDLQWETATYSPLKAYAMAKLFNIYFTRSIAVKYGPKGVTSFALHPGVVNTNFGEGLSGSSRMWLWLARPFMITAEQGAQGVVYLATGSRIDAKSGKYFKDGKVHSPSARATDDDARKKLWEMSLEMIEPLV
ncbi:SDR family oxidoreductase [Mucilaginibacter psychrotolerans]|uniref:SDR family oxidoreductase n=1 Tax=Mucilaginibacter psychrotolerans TaxID=1524096 RepID=A0A4Y8SFA2_9SPHI|nr:SDR family oxidoreductase [Mucilaginibacter psychrotolerans]TFF37351.1 SDR family oxidoreductase [Mucilaginibacter psychrotolerans]